MGETIELPTLITHHVVFRTAGTKITGASTEFSPITQLTSAPHIRDSVPLQRRHERIPPAAIGSPSAAPAAAPAAEGRGLHNFGNQTIKLPLQSVELFFQGAEVAQSAVPATPLLSRPAHKPGGRKLPDTPDPLEHAGRLPVFRGRPNPREIRQLRPAAQAHQQRHVVGRGGDQVKLLPDFVPAEACLAKPGALAGRADPKAAFHGATPRLLLSRVRQRRFQGYGA